MCNTVTGDISFLSYKTGDSWSLIVEITSYSYTIRKILTFVTKTVLPVKDGEICNSAVPNSNTEALVSFGKARVFKVMIIDELAVSEIKTKYGIYAMTKYVEDYLLVIDHNGQGQICIIDKNVESMVKTILKDNWTLFEAPLFLGFNSADKNNIYVLDGWKVLDGRIMFNYRNQEAELYHGLVFDSDGLFIGSKVDNKPQVETLNLSGERQEVYSIFNDTGGEKSCFISIPTKQRYDWVL